MALLPIVLYGDPILRKKALPIGEITPEIRRLVEEMTETMVQGASSVGLAAPQIGLSLRLFVMRDEVGSGDDFEFGPPEVIINPVFSHPSPKTETHEEGCLSLPRVYLDVIRPAKIHVRYTTLDGTEKEELLEGFRARVFMHENDHLNGTLIIDRVPANVRNKIDPILRKIKAGALSKRG